MKYVFSLLLFVCSIEVVVAQTDLKQYIKETRNNQIALKEGNALRAEQVALFFLDLKEMDKETNELRCFCKIDTLNGFNIYKFDHFINNIQVEDSRIFIIEDQRETKYIWGKLRKPIKISLVPIFTAEQALENAVRQIGNIDYAWLDLNWQNSIKKETKDSLASFKPKGELVITKINDQEQHDSSELILAWKFEITVTEPFDCFQAYVDASNGKYFKRRENINKASGICATLYNGSQNLITKYRGIPFFNFILKDDTRGELCVKWYSDYNSYLGWDAAPHISDSDNNWNSLEERPATSLLWGLEKAYDYFKNRFSWLGTNGDNCAVRGLADANDTYFLRRNGTDYVHTGYVGANSTADLEIISHEYTHGIISHTSDLVYGPYESGALNESFADIFGIVSNHYTTGSNDWHIGTSIGGLRDFINPHYNRPPYQYSQPAYYNEVPYWNSYSGDPHINSGVQNHWFYLLSEGGTYRGITVEGIGITKAAHIAWHTMINLPSDATFAETRDISMSIAQLKYGSISCERKAVQNAWAAVNVGSSNNSPCNPLLVTSINGPYEMCYYQNQQFNAAVSGGTGIYNYAWYRDRGDNNFFSIGSSSSVNIVEYNNPIPNSQMHLKLVVTSGTQTNTVYHTVWMNNCLKSTKSLKDSSIFILDLDKEDLIVSPNPASDYFVVQFKDNTIVSDFELINSLGEIIQSVNSISNSTRIDCSDLPKGLYVLKAKINNKLIIKKVLVQ